MAKKRMQLHLQLFVATLLSCGQLLAQQPRGVPSKLFGIKLGGVHSIGGGDKNDLGDMPVAAFAGSNTFMGNGIHYYFKPMSEQKAFPYFEKRKSPSDEYFETSFRLYLLPVIPPAVKTMSDLEKLAHKWEVTTIEWSNDAKTKEAAYYWARDLCETFTIDIGLKPEVIDYYEEKSYVCTFSNSQREFEVRSMELMRIVSLSFGRDVFDRKNKAVEAILRKLAANEIRPYEQ